jgi:DNA-binding MarR family transcriptional regulator
MAAKNSEDDLPDAGESLRQLARLGALWRRADFTQGLKPVHWDVLRYLNIANRYSTTPGALTDYLGATKGTISQTLGLLEKKGLIAKSGRIDDKRSVSLRLTESAIAVLVEDQRHLSADIVDGLRPKAQRRFAQAVDALATAEALRLSAPSFGVCSTCIYFRESQREMAARCMKFEADVSDTESELICAEHQRR